MGTQVWSEILDPSKRTNTLLHTLFTSASLSFELTAAASLRFTCAHMATVKNCCWREAGYSNHPKIDVCCWCKSADFLIAYKHRWSQTAQTRWVNVTFRSLYFPSYKTTHCICIHTYTFMSELGQWEPKVTLPGWWIWTNNNKFVNLQMSFNIWLNIWFYCLIRNIIKLYVLSKISKYSSYYDASAELSFEKLVFEV